MKRPLLIIALPILLIPWGGQFLFAEDPMPQAGSELFSAAGFEMQIVARLVESGGETVWDMDLTRQTISGRAVQVRLEGENLVVLAQFTPYKQRGGEQEDDNDESTTIVLVAQGQTWVSLENEDDVRYRTAYKSLPLELGEPLYFFPLGVNYGEGEEPVTNLEIEILVEHIDDSELETQE